MSKMNRLANCRNEYQGKRKRVLCVCSAGLLRSPTIAWVLSNPPYDCNTRAAGISDEYALIPVDDVLVRWADEIVCADLDHAEFCVKLLGDSETPVHNLRLPDDYEFRNPALVERIKKELERVRFKG